MHLDLEEQEQLAQLKAFWKDYGRWITIGILIACLAYATYFFYQRHLNQVSLQASEEFEALTTAATKADLPTVFAKADALQKEFPSTAYAAMAGLVAANLANASGNFEQSVKSLQWVEEHSSSAGLQNLARFRWVSILLDKGDSSSLSQADALLNKDVVEGFEALKKERRGDWFLVQDKKEEARKSYIEAWNTLSDQVAKASGIKEIDPMMKQFEQKNPADNQKLLKVKIDSLGGF